MDVQAVKEIFSQLTLKELSWFHINTGFEILKRIWPILFPILIIGGFVTVCLIVNYIIIRIRRRRGT